MQDNQYAAHQRPLCGGPISARSELMAIGWARTECTGSDLAGNARGPRTIASPARRCYAGPKSPRGKDSGMPLLVFLILVILIAQLGFWDTFSAIIGAVAMIVLFVLLALALVALTGLLLIRRLRR